ncbi:hypothetical protein [Trujillonella endophytica]|uniref:Uncharacterized protein n=1 Tax=Trujillonella endophytica TaxID=673521 RepID=A0A1H8PMG5_9ACTN|nr:hypothetical protein [Trujillella endophytica]SEO42907.1 hypothetical protein SAMN05660991_00260 [Trujillella endophytica]
MPTSPERFPAACGPALADLERTRPGAVRVTWQDGPEPLLWLQDEATPSAVGVWVTGIAGSPEEVRELTERVQDAAVDLLWGAWPECPDHEGGHPLAAEVHDGAVAWACPRTGRVVAPVGELPPPGGFSA